MRQFRDRSQFKIAGTQIPINGINQGQNLISTQNSVGVFTLDTGFVDLGIIPANKKSVSVYQNGKWIKDATGTITISGLYPGQILTCNLKQNYGYLPGYKTTGFYAVPIRGNKIKLTWNPINNKVDPNKDFYAYQIYWDAGTGTIDKLWVQNIGVDNCTAIITGLSEGLTYQFKICSVDTEGNSSSYTSILSGKINKAPSAPTNVSISYNQSSRVATITGTKTSQSDCRGYYIFHNFIPEYGLTNFLNFDNPIYFTPQDSNAISFNTTELSLGNHIFAVVAVDATGIYSDFSMLKLNLYKQGGLLKQNYIKPDAIKFYDVYSISGGKFHANIELSNLSNITSIEVLLDSVHLYSIPIVANQFSYTWESSTIADGQHTVMLRGVNNTVNGDSVSIPVVIDGTPPTVPSNLKIEVI